MYVARDRCHLGDLNVCKPSSASLGRSSKLQHQRDACHLSRKKNGSAFGTHHRFSECFWCGSLLSTPNGRAARDLGSHFDLHAAAAAWLAPISKTNGPVIEYSSPINLSIMMRPVWKVSNAKKTQNCLRHSGASYRLAATGNAPQTALELGTSVQMLMQHYRELVTKEDAETWFAPTPAAAPPAQ